MVNTHQIGVKAIIEKDDAILLIKRSDKYKEQRYRDLVETWDIPGGRLESLEGLEEGLEREVAEETGLRIEQIKEVLEVKTVFKSEREHIVRVTYICSVYGGPVILSGEHTRAEWFQKQDLAGLQYKDDILRDTLKKYCERKQQ